MMIFPDPPRCLFCEDKMRESGANISGNASGLIKNNCQFYYTCTNTGCFVNADFPRYKVSVDGYGTPFEQEYAVDDIYVKVFPDQSLIYYLQGCMLLDEVRVPRAFWLNPTNICRTLDRLRLLITFS